MKKNLILTLRNLKKQKKYTFINILGLSLGLACFILISIWVQDELSYDNFHKDADNVYIVFRNQNDKKMAVTSKLLAPAIKEEIPEIVESTCFMQLPESFSPVLQYEDKKYIENISIADNHFFDVFSFPLLEGDRSKVFSSPESILISERIKQKYFADKNAIGNSISITTWGIKKLLKVTGVMANIPHNSHIQADIILPIESIKDFGWNWDQWYNQAPRTYFRTGQSVPVAELEEKIQECKQSHFPEKNVTYSVLPIKQIHLHSSNIEYFTATGDIKYIYIFSAIAVIILLIASMNYMNLSNALSLKRSKEIGIKKALGSKRKQIIQQYISETFILVFIALIVSFSFVQLLLPAVNNMSGKHLSIPYSNPTFILIVLGIFILTSVISAFYPALFISRFNPILVLKGKMISSPQSKNIRQGLVIFQFVLSITIIIGTITISNQLNFIQNANLGFDKEHIVCMHINGDISKNYDAFKDELVRSGLVTNICRSASMDPNFMSQTYEIDWPEKQNKFQTWILSVDEDFAQTYRIKMAKGRFYSQDFPSDLTNGFVVNQAAVKEMGFKNPIDHELTVWGRKGTIIGVTNDFNFNSLHNKIEPLILHIPNPEQVNFFCTTLSMRIKPNSLPQSLDYIEKTWKSYFPNDNFSYNFFDKKLQTIYLSESRMASLFKYFSILVILIACMGLYGLTAFTIEQKSKEIGVYKVMGATIPEVMLLFSKGYIFRIIIACIIASPIAYYFLHLWLENFAYKISLSWWIFPLAGIIALAIALLTVTWQSWKAATSNPVDALRNE